MSHTSENMNSAGAEEEHQRESTQERPADTVTETFDRIKRIEEQTEPKPDVRVAEMALRLGVDKAQLETAEQVVGFAERSRALTEKIQGIKDKFQENIRRALLPVATALAMNSAPALAQEANTERSTTNGPEVVSVAKSESRELKKEDVFDLNSPLAITGEKMKGLKREMSPPELALMKDFQQKVWQEENEWMAVSGRGKQGKYYSEIKEAGPTGGELAFDVLEDIVSEKSVNHTHPVAVGRFIGLSPEAIQSIQKKELNSFIMPPSAVDIGGCMNDAGTDTIQRVVDPRGVWEYRCDEHHPFVISRKRVVEDLNTTVEEVKTKYGVRDDDLEQASSAIGTTHPALMTQSLFSELDKKYPGIEKSGQMAITKIVARNSDFALAMLSYDGSGGILARASRNLSEGELSSKIQKFVQDSAKIGVYMSYTPFKELPNDKELQKE